MFLNIHNYSFPRQLNKISPLHVIHLIYIITIPPISTNESTRILHGRSIEESKCITNRLLHSDRAFKMRVRLAEFGYQRCKEGFDFFVSW